MRPDGGRIFIWRDYYRTEYAISGGILYFKVYYPGFGTLFTLPQGGDRREEYRQIQEYCTRRNMPLAFYPIPKEELGALQDYFPCTTAITDRNSFDYLYRSEDLNTSGQKAGRAAQPRQPLSAHLWELDLHRHHVR